MVLERLQHGVKGVTVKDFFCPLEAPKYMYTYIWPCTHTHKEKFQVNLSKTSENVETTENDRKLDKTAKNGTVLT